MSLFLCKPHSLADIAGEDSKSDWKKLKDQLCDCGDANVASFLTNLRRSNAVMQLSLASLALLRPLRAAFISNTLSCQCNHSHYVTFPPQSSSLFLQRLPSTSTNILKRSSSNSTTISRIGISLPTILITGWGFCHCLLLPLLPRLSSSLLRSSSAFSSRAKVRD